MLSVAALLCLVPAARLQDEVPGRFGEYVRAIDGLAHPADVAFSPDGTLWVVETDAHRAVRIDLSGARLEEVASELPFPERVVVAEGGGVTLAPRSWDPPTDTVPIGDGRSATCDAGSHRVRVGDDEWGDFGPYRGLFAEPWGLAFHAGRLFVADRENHRVQVFLADGTYLYEWGRHPLAPGEGEGALHYPTAIAISPDGEHAVVAEPMQDRLQVFRKTDRPASEFVTNPVLLSSGVPAHFGVSLHAAGQLMLAARPESRIVLVFDLRGDTPIEIARLGGNGTRPGKLRAVGDVWLSEDPWTAHVTDPVARTVSTWFLDYDQAGELRMDPTLGRFARMIDLEAALAAQGHATDIVPGAIAVGPDGRLFVADHRTPRVLSLDSRGRFAGWIGAEVLVDPIDLAIRGEDLLVLDRAGGFQQAFSFDGTPGQRIEFEGKVGRAAALCALPDGTLLVSDAARHQIVQLPDGAPRWGGQGLAAGETYKPGGLCVDGRRRVILSDHGNHRLQVFDEHGEFVTALGPRLYVNPANRP